MSRREAILKATSVAMQPDSLNLGDLRQLMAGEEAPVRAPREHLLGALAYTALDVVDPDFPDLVDRKGDPLPAALFRLKYGKQVSRETMVQATRLLLRLWTTGGAARKRRAPDVMVAIAQTAVFEWVNDQCRKCRDLRRAGLFRKGSKGERDRGMLCRACSNSGLQEMHPRTRWGMVNAILRGIAERRGEEDFVPLAYEIFTGRWLGKYRKMREEILAAEKRIAKSIDIQISQSENRATDYQPE